MSKGLVYILTNPCLDGWVKIGMTKKNDVQERLKELNRPPNIPLSYQCYATYEVENPYDVEQSVHRLIDKVDLSLHARETLSNGKVRQREFFRLSPEVAYGILEEVATLRGDLEKLKLYDINDDINICEEKEDFWDLDKPSSNDYVSASLDKLFEEKTIVNDETTNVPTNEQTQTKQKKIFNNKNINKDKKDSENTSIIQRIEFRKDRRRIGKRKPVSQ